MANDVKVRETVRNAGVDAELSGVTKMRLYTGTKPATPETALGAQIQLSDHVATPGAAAAGASTIVIADDIDADADGTATWGSLLTAGNVRQVDFTVGTSGCDLNIDDAVIVQYGLVRVGSFVYSRP